MNIKGLSAPNIIGLPNSNEIMTISTEIPIMEKRNIVEKEFNKNETKKEDVKLLQEWAESQLFLPKITEQEAIWFLQSRYNNMDAAKIAIDKYFTMRTMGPEIFSNRNINLKNLQIAKDIITYIILPEKSRDGDTVVLMKILDPSPSNFVFNDNIKLFDMVLMADIYSNGSHEGTRFLFDVKPISLGHLARISFVPMRKMIVYGQEAMPTRLKGIHFFNTSSVMDKLMSLMKPFLKKEIVSLITLHRDVKDLDKFIPIEHFPSDYGGQSESVAVLKEKTDQLLMDNNDFFAFQETQLVDESKRPEKPKKAFSIFGLKGIFKG